MPSLMNCCQKYRLLLFVNMHMVQEGVVHERSRNRPAFCGASVAERSGVGDGSELVGFARFAMGSGEASTRPARASLYLASHLSLQLSK